MTEPLDPAAAEQPTAAAAVEPDEGVVAEGVVVEHVVVEHDDDGQADDWEAVQAQKAERERRRRRQTVRDMVLSMAVVTVVVLLLVAPWNWSTPDPVKEVDPTPVIAGAREQIDWPVLAPTLPAGWRATSARIETADDGQPIVVLGYVSPDQEYVGLQQSDTRITDFVKDVTLDGAPAGEVTIKGTAWERLVDADQTRRSLVSKDGDVTYVVTGTGPWAQVEAFTATLTAG